MSTTLNEKKRICNVLTNGPLPELGFITGPVMRCRLSTNKIITLVSNGRKVYEIDPKDSSNTVLLTVGNCEVSPFEGNDETPVVEKPAVEEPKQVVMDNFQKDFHHMSKSERKRLKYQQQQMHNGQVQNNNIVNEPTKQEEVVENSPVEETKDASQTIAVNTPLASVNAASLNPEALVIPEETPNVNDESDTTSDSVEEAVETADMQ